jgi:hypothetical protein
LLQENAIEYAKWTKNKDSQIKPLEKRAKKLFQERN